MAIWEKEKFYDAFNKVIYLDEIGYGILPKEKIDNYRFETKARSFTCTELYLLMPDNHFRSIDTVDIPICEIAFKMPIYSCSSFIRNEFNMIELTALRYQTSIPTISSIDDLAKASSVWQKVPFTFSFSNLEDLESGAVWTFDAAVKKAFKSLHYNEKLGGEYYLLGIGKCCVKEVYDYLERDGAMCSVEMSDGTIKRIFAGDKTFITTPSTFEQSKAESEINFFNEQKKESLLLPYADLGENGVTVFWKDVPNAVEYVIEVYRLIKGKLGSKPYLLSSFNVPSDHRYYFLPNQELAHLGSPIIYRVIAKSERGEVLAFSRGIEKGYPKYFD